MENNDKKYYVYVCSVNNNSVYVGKGSGDRYKHCTSGRSSCAELNRDLFKYGVRAFSVIKVLEGLTEQEAFEYEKAAIIAGGNDFYNRVHQYNPGKHRLFPNEDKRECDVDKGIYFWYCWAIINDPDYKWNE